MKIWRMRQERTIWRILEGVIIPALIAYCGFLNVRTGWEELKSECSTFSLNNCLITFNFSWWHFQGMISGLISFLFALILIKNVWLSVSKQCGYEKPQQFIFPLIAQLWILLPLSWTLWPAFFFYKLNLWNDQLGIALSLGTTFAGLILILLGLKELGTNFRIVAVQVPRIKTGIFRFVKHPIYSGQVLFLFANFLIFPCWFNVNLVVTLALIQWRRSQIEDEFLLN